MRLALPSSTGHRAGIVNCRFCSVRGRFLSKLWSTFPALLGAALLAFPCYAEPVLGPLGDRTLSVLNRSKINIHELYAAPQSAEVWGADQLGDAMVEPGGSVRLKLGRVRDCTFDLLAVYDDSSQEEMRGVNVCRTREVSFTGALAKRPVQPSGPARHVTVTNGSPLPMQQLFISAPDAAQWGDDRLSQSAMSVGEDRQIDFTGACRADMRVVFANRAAEERRNLDLCANPTLRVAPGWTTQDRPDDN